VRAVFPLDVNGSALACFVMTVPVEKKDAVSWAAGTPCRFAGDA